MNRGCAIQPSSGWVRILTFDGSIEWGEVVVQPPHSTSTTPPRGFSCLQDQDIVICCRTLSSQPQCETMSLLSCSLVRVVQNRSPKCRIRARNLRRLTRSRFNVLALLRPDSDQSSIDGFAARTGQLRPGCQ